MGIRDDLLTRARALRDAGMSYNDWIELRQRINSIVDAFHAAVDKLDEAYSDYLGLKPEYITCRLQGHVYLNRFEHVGYNVRGYGETYTNTCDRCGGTAWRMRAVGSGKPNGSAFDPPKGYTLSGIKFGERLFRRDITALEMISDIDTVIRRLEKEYGLAPKAIPDRRTPSTQTRPELRVVS